MNKTEIITYSNSRMPKGFAILCYPCWNDELSDKCIAQYEIFFGSNAKDNKEITKSQANYIIKQHNLLLVVDSVDGKVWE